jgi:RNA polymerase sigma-70 factor, ECF subfamily
MQLQLLDIPDIEPATWSGDREIGNGAIVKRALEMIRGDFEDRTWQSFWLTTIDGKSPVDIASEFGIGVDSVYQAKSRVLKRLREELMDQFQDF